MKNFIKKHLSVILSFAIILGTILPVLSGIIGVSALSAEEQIVVDQIKSGWSSLLNIDKNVGFYPNRWAGPNGGSFVSTGMANAANYSETLPEGVNLGNRYATLTGLGAEGVLDTKQAVLFEFKDGSNVTTGGQDRTSYNITEVEDIFFWVKLDNLTTDATLKIKINDIGTQAGSKTLPDFVISAAKSGQWVKVSLKELGGSSWYGNLTNKLYRTQVALINVDGATATIGSAFVGKKVAVPSDSDTADWTLAQWIKAATQVDLSLYENTESLTAALNTAKASFGEQYAIGDLMREWEALANYHDPDINPNRWWYATSGSGGTGMAAASTYPDALPEGVDLGAYYATFTNLGNQAGLQSKQCILYEFCKDGNSTGIIPYAKTAIPITQISDISFWFKADNMSTDITLRFQPLTNDSGVKTHILPDYVIPAAKSGQWVKVSLKELGGSNWYGNLTEKLYRINVAMFNAEGATITAGAGRLAIPNAYPLPENLGNNAQAWINAARSLNLSNCVDATKFNAALQSLKVYSSEDPNVEILKQEWAKLEYISEPVDEGFKVWYWKNNGSTYKDNDANNKLVYDSSVDTAYGYYQFTGTDITATTGAVASFRRDNGDNPSGYTVSQLDDLYFWYKATGDVTVKITINGLHGTDKYAWVGSLDNHTLTGDNTWRKMSFKADAAATLESIKANYGTRKITRFQIDFKGIEAGLGDVDFTFGGLYSCPKDTSLEGSENWTNEQWVDNALALDLSKYENTEAFVTATYAALESVYGYTEKDLVAKELIAAWGEMGNTETFNVLPNRWAGTNGKPYASTGMSSVANYPSALPEEVNLGSHYTTLTGLTADGAIDTKQDVLYEFIDGSRYTADGGDKTSYSITEITDIYFWIKLDNLTTDATLNFKITAKGTNTPSQTLPSYTIPAEKNGQWVKVSFREVRGENWYGSLVDNLYRFQVALSNVNGVTATLGSGIIEKKCGAPANIDNMPAEEVLTQALALDLSTYSNTEKFLEKLEELKLLCEETVAIGNLKAAIQNLMSKDTVNILPNRWISNTLKEGSSDTCTVENLALQASASYSGALPEGVELGSKYAVISGLGDAFTYEKRQQIIFEFKDENKYIYAGRDRTTYLTTDIDDVYFWVKLDNLTKEAAINVRVYIQEKASQKDMTASVKIPASASGQWVKVSLKDMMGSSWNTGLEGKLYRLGVGISNAAGATLTVGSGTIIAKAGLTLEGNEGWNIADWITEALRNDYSQYLGYEAFKEALKNAIAVRDNLMIGRSFTVTEYDDLTAAETALSTITAENCLLGKLPTVYHSVDGETRQLVEDVSPEQLTDGDFTTVGAVTGLDNTNEASFTDFVYDFEGDVNIKDFFIFNDQANTASKYYIYMAENQSELFLQSNIVAAYNNESGKAIERFNYDGKPQVKGNYLGIRVYTNTNTVSFAEFAAYGEIVIYELKAGTLSGAEIKNLGDNLLEGLTPKFRLAGAKQTFRQVIKNTSYVPEALTDADTGTGVPIYGAYVIDEKDDKISVHFYYDLGTTHTINRLFINHWQERGLQTGRYEIYAANDLNSLFTSRSKLVDYNNMVDGPNSTTDAQVFDLKKEIIARYVSFHITYPISDWDYCETREGYQKLYGVRIAEFGVYGEKWVKPYALVNLTSHTPVDVYRTEADGNRAKVSEAEYDGIKSEAKRA